jgi:mRNA interferase MazF
MIRRGEIYEVDLGQPVGSEQGGRTPALVIQNDVGNETAPNTIVAAITSQPRRPYPFQVAISRADSGLRKESIVMLEQIRTVSQARLGKRLGRLHPDQMAEVDAAIHHSLGLVNCGR